MNKNLIKEFLTKEWKKEYGMKRVIIILILLLSSQIVFAERWQETGRPYAGCVTSTSYLTCFHDPLCFSLYYSGGEYRFVSDSASTNVASVTGGYHATGITPSTCALGEACCGGYAQSSSTGTCQKGYVNCDSSNTNCLASCPDYLIYGCDSGKFTNNFFQNLQTCMLVDNGVQLDYGLLSCCNADTVSCGAYNGCETSCNECETDNDCTDGASLTLDSCVTSEHCNYCVHSTQTLNPLTSATVVRTLNNKDYTFTLYPVLGTNTYYVDVTSNGEKLYSKLRNGDYFFIEGESYRVFFQTITEPSSIQIYKVAFYTRTTYNIFPICGNNICETCESSSNCLHYPPESCLSCPLDCPASSDEEIASYNTRFGQTISFLDVVNDKDLACRVKTNDLNSLCDPLCITHEFIDPNGCLFNRYIPSLPLRTDGTVVTGGPFGELNSTTLTFSEKTFNVDYSMGGGFFGTNNSACESDCECLSTNCNGGHCCPTGYEWSNSDEFATAICDPANPGHALVTFKNSLIDKNNNGFIDNTEDIVLAGPGNTVIDTTRAVRLSTYLCVAGSNHPACVKYGYDPVCVYDPSEAGGEYHPIFTDGTSQCRKIKRLTEGLITNIKCTLHSHAWALATCSKPTGLGIPSIVANVGQGCEFYPLWHQNYERKETEICWFDDCTTIGYWSPTNGHWDPAGGHFEWHDKLWNMDIKITCWNNLVPICDDGVFGIDTTPTFDYFCVTDNPDECWGGEQVRTINGGGQGVILKSISLYDFCHTKALVCEKSGYIRNEDTFNKNSNMQGGYIRFSNCPQDGYARSDLFQDLALITDTIASIPMSVGYYCSLFGNDFERILNIHKGDAYGLTSNNIEHSDLINKAKYFPGTMYSGNAFVGTYVPPDIGNWGFTAGSNYYVRANHMAQIDRNEEERLYHELFNREACVEIYGEGDDVPDPVPSCDGVATGQYTLVDEKGNPSHPFVGVYDYKDYYNTVVQSYSGKEDYRKYVKSRAYCEQFWASFEEKGYTMNLEATNYGLVDGWSVTVTDNSKSPAVTTTYVEDSTKGLNNPMKNLIWVSCLYWSEQFQDWYYSDAPANNYYIDPPYKGWSYSSTSAWFGVTEVKTLDMDYVRSDQGRCGTGTFPGRNGLGTIVSGAKCSNNYPFVDTRGGYGGLTRIKTPGRTGWDVSPSAFYVNEYDIVVPKVCSTCTDSTYSFPTYPKC